MWGKYKKKKILYMGYRKDCKTDESGVRIYFRNIRNERLYRQ